MAPGYPPAGKGDKGSALLRVFIYPRSQVWGQHLLLGVTDLAILKLQLEEYDPQPHFMGEETEAQNICRELG